MKFRFVTFGVVALLGAVPSFAQLLSFGVKGGIPITDPVDGSFRVNPEARRYIVGPTAEIRLPMSFSVEVSALYRRTGYSTMQSAFGSTDVTRVRSNVWEFPMLLKYHVGNQENAVRPFVDGGYVLRHFSGLTASSSSVPSLDSRFLLRNDITHGVAAGGGVEFRVSRFKIAPEFRYTYWGSRAFDEFGSRGFFVRSNQHQADILLGIRF